MMKILEKGYMHTAHISRYQTHTHNINESHSFRGGNLFIQPDDNDYDDECFRQM